MQIDNNNFVPLTLDNCRGTDKIKQHIFVLNYEYKYGDMVESNISLCGKIKGRQEYSTPLSIKKLIKDAELINKNCCKICLNMVTHEQIINELKKDKYNLEGLERGLNMPKKTLIKAISGTRKIPKKYLESLVNELKL